MDSLTAPTGVPPATPREAPLAMPVQSLRTFDRRERRRWVSPRNVHAPWLARIAVFGGAAALTAYGAREMYGVVAVGEITTLEWALVVLFVVNFAWIALAFASSVYGFVWLLRAPRLGPLPQKLESRTAVVMPIYNEAPARVFAAVQATGLGDHFDYFFLSDTTNPDLWIAEERALLAMRERLAGERVYYRRRRKNTARKAGNIADFVTRWGAAYPHMLVLDADSLISGATIVRLAAAMEADPDAGMVQSVPLIVNRNTFFARLQQFAARIAGPVIAAGLSAWMGRDGNYWGHNAIIRTRAFADHCGMPELPGKPPFGGHILSHDFVEAALMRRAGWAVYMLPTLGGSFEESPPSLIDLATRDRRWCQGNLQHSRLLFSSGLAFASRLHLVNGIMGYLASPLWMAQLLIGIVLVLQSRFIRPEYFTAEFSLFPTWPRFDYERALQLFELTIAVLLAPKIFGMVLAGLDRDRQLVLRRRQRAGGVWRESAWRIVSLVEVQHHFAVFSQLRVEESAAAIGLLASGQVPKNEGQFVRRFLDRRQAQLLAVYLKLHVSGAGGVFDLAQNVENRDLPRIRHQARSNAVLLPHREIMQASELLAQPAVVVFEPDAVLAAALDNEHGQAAYGDGVRLPVGIRLQITHLQTHAKRDLALGQDERAAVVERRVRGEHNVIGSRGAESVHALVQPEQSGNRQPSAIRGERRLPVPPPFLDLRAVGIRCRPQDTAHHEEHGPQSHHSPPSSAC